MSSTVIPSRFLLAHRAAAATEIFEMVNLDFGRGEVSTAFTMCDTRRSLHRSAAVAHHLSSEDSILFDQVGHTLLLPTVAPAGQNREKQPRGCQIDTAGVYITDRRSNLRSFGRGVGH
jgi:hypothetical protein